MRKLRHDNRGIAAVAIVIVIVVIAAIGGVGWYVMKNKDNTASKATTPEAKAVLDDCLREVDDKEFCAFASNYENLGAYKSVITTTSSEGNSVISMDTDANGNTSLITRQDGNETAAYITLDNSTYIKDYSDNSWFKYPSGSSANPRTDLEDDVKIDFSQANVPEAQRLTYKRISEEACGNLTCLKYQIIDPASASSTQYIWFDTKDYQLRRWSNAEGDNSSEMTVEYGAVTITAPSPVKESDNSVPSPTDL